MRFNIEFSIRFTLMFIRIEFYRIGTLFVFNFGRILDDSHLDISIVFSLELNELNDENNCPTMVD